jgi:hypothetical protein
VAAVMVGVGDKRSSYRLTGYMAGTMDGMGVVERVEAAWGCSATNSGAHICGQIFAGSYVALLPGETAAISPRADAQTWQGPNHP